MSHLLRSLRPLCQNKWQPPQSLVLQFRSFNVDNDVPASKGVRDETPIPFDKSKPFVAWRAHAGEQKCNIKISSSSNTNKVTSELSALLSAKWDGEPTTLSFGTPCWRLCTSWDSLMRFFSFETETELQKFREEVEKASNKLNHHPNIIPIPPIQGTGGKPALLITCSTHEPPGLSMRDIKLAGKISEMASQYITQAPVAPENHPPLFFEKKRRFYLTQEQMKRLGPELGRLSASELAQRLLEE